MSETTGVVEAPGTETPGVEPVFTPLPEGLAELAPGPALAAMLATVDRAMCNGYQLSVLLQARQRQRCYDEAQLLADMHELAYARTCGPDKPPARSASRDPHAADEIAFALAWSCWSADETLGVAWEMLTELPALFTALVEGRVDLMKAKLIVREVDLLEPDQARAILDQVLDGVEFLSPGALRDLIRRLVLTADPDAVRKRHRRALEHRSVAMRTYKDGTCSITGHYLPADKAAAAMDFLTRTAVATKKAGDPHGTRFDDRDRRTLDQIRTDVFLDLLAGADPTVAAIDGGAGAVNPAARKGTVHVTVDLATLLCMNDHPGELAGFGPIVAQLAREVVDQLTDTATFRFVVTHDGRVIHEHRLHYRPTEAQRAYVLARDKTCRAPGCRRPAHQCEIDHILAREDRGITHEDNLCTACKRHHGIKHNGFSLHRTDFGLLWISPRGRTYPVTFSGRELDADQRRLLQHLVDQGEFPDHQPQD